MYRPPRINPTTMDDGLDPDKDTGGLMFFGSSTILCVSLVHGICQETHLVGDGPVRREVQGSNPGSGSRISP